MYMSRAINTDKYLSVKVVKIVCEGGKRVHASAPIMGTICDLI